MFDCKDRFGYKEYSAPDTSRLITSSVFSIFLINFFIFIRKQLKLFYDDFYGS